MINQNDYNQISKHLKYDVNLILKDKVTSTNDVIKEMADNTDNFTVLSANEQTKGKGRMGRSFYSPDNSGIYMSILLKDNLKVKDSLLLTVKSAVAVAKAIEKLSGAVPQIKWVNDIYINGKKVCGILTEGRVSKNNIDLDYAIVGIGVNITPIKNIPDEIKNIAGSVFEEDINVKNEMIAEIINQFFCVLNRDVLKDYHSYLMLKDKTVEVINSKGNYLAKVIDVDNDFQLIVENDKGERLVLNSGEVRIKNYEKN